MRWWCWWIALYASACYMGPTPTDDTDAGASVCDGKDSCEDCLSCANAHPCAELVSSCVVDADCAAIDQCVVLCGADATCQQQCLVNNPNGAVLYNAAQDCRYCEQCPGDCAGYRDCP